MTTPADRRRTTWPTAEPLQQAADNRRAAGDPLLADWLDETANALSWLAPFRDNEPGYGMWEAALAVARQVLGTTGEQPETEAPAARPASPIDEVRAWNEGHPVGTPVRVWTGFREGDGTLTRTRSRASVLGTHTAVVWVDGEGSCISLSHVDPEPTP